MRKREAPPTPPMSAKTRREAEGAVALRSILPGFSVSDNPSSDGTAKYTTQDTLGGVQ
jgi:hypothetical protein